MKIEQNIEWFKQGSLWNYLWYQYFEDYTFQFNSIKSKRDYFSFVLKLLLV